MQYSGSKENYEKAKKIFFEYKGSRSGIAREEKESEYSSYKIPEEIEKIWRAEMIDQSLNMPKANLSSTKILSTAQLILEEKLYNKIPKLLENVIEFFDEESTFDILVLLDVLPRRLKEYGCEEKAIQNNISVFIQELEKMKLKIKNGTFTFPDTQSGRIHKDRFTSDILEKRVEEAIDSWKILKRG